MGDTPLTEEQQQKRRQAVVELMPTTPFIAFLGLEFEKFETDDVRTRLPFREDLTNDGTFYHGGVVSSVLDTTGALAAWSNHDFDKGARASTVSMSVNYVGACRKSDMICTATTIKRGKELVFTEIIATDTNGRPVAHAIQTYRLGG